MEPFDFGKWLDENAKHMTRFTLNGETLGIVRDGEKYYLYIDIDDTLHDVAEFYDLESVLKFKDFLFSITETS